MICPKCNAISLTNEEQRLRKGMCFFCFDEIINKMNQQTGGIDSLQRPNSEMFGRPQETLAESMAYRNEQLAKNRMANSGPSLLNAAGSNDSANASSTQQNVNIDPNYLNEMKSFLPGADNRPEPWEFKFQLNDETFIHTSLPGPVTIKVQKQIEQLLIKYLADFVKMRYDQTVFGQYFRDPDEPQGNNGMPPGMM